MNRTPFEVELADRLSRLADRAPATPGDRSTPIELEPAVSGRSLRLGLLAGVAVALVAVVAGSWLLDRSDSSDLVATDATPTSDDARSDVPLDWPLVGDEWSTISAGPADGRAFAVQVWTGAELIVWGGESEPETTWTGDGAAYDPLTDLWRPLAPSPLSARSEHLGVWTGTEVLICCGRAPSGEGQAAAAYDPVADTWRVLSPPPFDSALGVAVWTGAEMIVTGGVDLQEAWAYSPASDVWRELSAPPTTIERSADIAWTGTQVIVWPGVFGTGSGLTYEPATDTWAALPSLPSDLAIWGGSMVWTGEEIVVWGNSRADDTDSVGARIRLDAPTWTAIADDPLEPFRWWNGVPGSNSAAWTGTEMIVWAGAMGESDGSTRTLAYDPAGDTWRELGTAPTTAFGPDLLWTGDVALAMTDPVTAIRPRAPSGDPAPTPRASPATIQGVLPNGDRYEISADPPLDSEVEGISAGIIIDLDDGTEPIEGPVVGIANFQKATGDERVGPNATGRSIVVVAGEWRLTIYIYDDVLEALGPDAASIIYDAIVPRTVADASDLPAFDLQAPLRWATDLEIPLHMGVQYREFVVKRGCSEVAAACSEDGTVEVVPTEEVVFPAAPWADRGVEILHLTDGTGADSHQQPLDLGPLEPRGGHSETAPPSQAPSAASPVGEPSMLVRYDEESVDLLRDGVPETVVAEGALAAYLVESTLIYSPAGRSEVRSVAIGDESVGDVWTLPGIQLHEAALLDGTPAALVSTRSGAGPEDFQVALVLMAAGEASPLVEFDTDAGWENGPLEVAWNGADTIAVLMRAELQLHRLTGERIATVPTEFDSTERLDGLVWVAGELWSVGPALWEPGEPSRLRIRRLGADLSVVEDREIEVSGLRVADGLCVASVEWDADIEALVCSRSSQRSVVIDPWTGAAAAIGSAPLEFFTVPRAAPGLD